MIRRNEEQIPVKGFHLLHALLCPLEILLHLFGRFHAIRKVGTAALESALSQRLQFHKLAILCIELARSKVC